MKFLPSSVLAVALLSSSLAAHANIVTNIVTNGGFEADCICGNPWKLLSNVTGWSSTGLFEIQKGSDTGGLPVFNTSYEGKQYLELNSTGLTTVSQLLPTVTGALYDLTFAYSGRSDTPGGLKSALEVFWGSDKLVSTKVSPHSDWIEYSFDDLVAGSSSTLLSFRSTGPIAAPGYGSYLDGVVVTAVPEPGVGAMLLAGLGAMGLMFRRRKSS